MAWKKMVLQEALTNREGRYKPNDKAIANLKRIDKINFSGKIFLSNKDSNTDMILIKKGDLVISGINVEKGAITVYEGDEDITATIHYSSYIFNTAKIDIEFLKVFLRSPDFINLLKEQVPGGIKTEIKPKHILPLEVNFPETIKEQQKIAKHFFEKEKKFSELEENISNQLTQIENLNQAILQEAVQGKLVAQNKNDEPGSELLKRIKTEKATLRQAQGKKEKPLPPINAEEIPFEIPKSWAWCRLGDLALYSEAGKSFKCKEVPIINDEWGVLKVSAISWDNFLEEKNKMYSRTTPTDLKAKVEIGDFIISRANTSELIGKSVVVKSLTKNLLLSDKTIRIRFSELVFIDFINKCNNALHARDYYSKMGTGSSPSMKNITREQMANLLIPLPPLSEQKRIVAEIEKQLAKTKQLKEHIIANQQATEQLLKALLHGAFEGEGDENS